MTKSSIRCLIAACVGVWCLSFPMGAFASGFSEPACTPYANQTWRLWPVDICSEPVRWDMEMHTCPEPVHTTGLVDLLGLGHAGFLGVGQQAPSGRR